MIAWLAAKGLRIQIIIAFPSPETIVPGDGSYADPAVSACAAIRRSTATLRHLGKERLANSRRQQTFSPTALVARERSENLGRQFSC